MAGGHAVAVVRTYVVPVRKPPVFILARRDHQVSEQRLKYMLVWPCGIGIAHPDGSSGLRGAHTIRNDAVVGKIAAADYVARPGRRNRRCVFSTEKAADVTMRHQLRAALGIGIRIIAIQWVVFPVAPDPFLVVVDLVGGYVEHAAHCIAHPYTFQQIHRTHHVGFIGVARFPVAVTNDGLCRQMQHNLRPGVIKTGLEHFKIPYIANHALHVSIKAGERKQVRLCGRLKAIARNLRSGQYQDTA